MLTEKAETGYPDDRQLTVFELNYSNYFYCCFIHKYARLLDPKEQKEYLAEKWTGGL